MDGTLAASASTGVIALAFVVGIALFACWTRWMIHQDRREEAARPRAVSSLPRRHRAEPVLQPVQAAAPAPLPRRVRRTLEPLRPAAAALPAAYLAAAPGAPDRPRPARRTTAPAAVVTAGAFCRVEGALGVTRTGTPMVCSVPRPGARPRWRKATRLRATA